MKTINYLFVIAMLAVFISSCKKDGEQTPVYLGYNYFPVDEGRVMYYDADSIITDEFNGTTTTHHFQIKEVVESTYTDNEGRPTQRIERYVRDSSNAPWGIFKICSSTLTNTRAERFEDNVRYVKLVFPVKENIHWNGNSLNTNEAWDYQYTNVNNGMTLNNTSYDSVLTVLQKDEDNAVNRTYFTEQYAAGVGMVYKENSFQKFIFGSSTVIDGYIYKETLTSYTP